MALSPGRLVTRAARRLLGLFTLGPYRHAASPEAGLRAIREGAGTQFDPEVAEAFADRMVGHSLATAMPQEAP